MEKATHRALMVRAARSGGQWVQARRCCVLYSSPPPLLFRGATPKEAGWGAAILSRVGLATQELMS